MELVVTMDDLLETSSDLALAELQSAKKAARIAGEAVDEVIALIGDAELVRGWAEGAAHYAGLAIAHRNRAAQYSPGSPAANEARAVADKAMAFAEAAAKAARGY